MFCPVARRRCVRRLCPSGADPRQYTASAEAKASVSDPIFAGDPFWGCGDTPKVVHTALTIESTHNTTM